ncbi:hypothetical protein COO60DRAFT_1634942 [Scenedesmus sp. NREL 46B-D3]|nr:hypothetical protein COO60DRAFT_1634942 [Scenedesmus sp. NREL 46B-D3]
MHEEGNTQAAEQHRRNYLKDGRAQAQFLCGLAGGAALTQHAAASSGSGSADRVTELLADMWEDPAATHSKQMASLLHLAVNLQDPSAAVAMLKFVQLGSSRLPAPQADDNHSLADLLQTAVQLQNSTFITALCHSGVGLAAMQDLPAEHLAPVLLLAVHLRNYAAMQQLLQLPSAAGMDTASVLGLLEAAVAGQGGERLVRSLLALPASRDINSSSAATLLRSSFGNGVDFKGGFVSRNDDEAGMDAVQQLLGLSPAADSLLAPHVFKIFKGAAQMNRAETLSMLCQLPGAAQLSPQQLYDVMEQALQHSRRTAAGAVYVLCTQLQSVAVQLDPLQGSAAIGRLLAPHGLNRSEAADLIRLNEDMGEAFDQTLTALLLGLVR